MIASMTDGAWAPADRSLYTYDEKDRLHSRRHYSYVAGEWTLTPVFRIEDDPNVVRPFWSLRADLTSHFGGYAELIFAYRTDLTGAPDRSAAVPIETALRQNYPNPFNPTTTIPFTINTGARTTVAIYDVLGREVARPVDEWKDPGEYNVQFDARGLASGMYLCRFTSGSTTQTHKLMLIR
jgi:hypothetical protein